MRICQLYSPAVHAGRTGASALERGSGFMERYEQQLLVRFALIGSAVLTLVGTGSTICSALRFRELSKRFFAIRLIFFLAMTNAGAALFSIFGAAVDVNTLLNPDSGISWLCALQTVGLLYFNLASIMWTSCFAFTLFRDVVPAPRRHALRKYEQYFHALCWPLPALLASGVSVSIYLGGVDSWCALGTAHLSRESLYAFYLPLVLAVSFNLLTCALDPAERTGKLCPRASHAHGLCTRARQERPITEHGPLLWAGLPWTDAAVLKHSAGRRVARITSLYLLSFALVWLPSLVCRLQVAVSSTAEPPFALAFLEASCSPLQGALNGLIFAWSLPSIRDVYRVILLGIADEGPHATPCSAGASYVPPEPVGCANGAPRPAPPLVCNGGTAREGYSYSVVSSEELGVATDCGDADGYGAVQRMAARPCADGRSLPVNAGVALEAGAHGGAARQRTLA